MIDDDSHDPDPEIQPWVPATDLHRLSSAEALALVDTHLGAAAEWPSALIKYRRSSDFQADWKQEVGHWLDTAKRHGFFDVLLHRVISRAKQNGGTDAVDPNDQWHRILAHELAPAMAVHYLVGTGWKFLTWEPPVGRGLDVDIELAAPDGTVVQIQVKAPDQPGGRAAGRIVDGEYDGRVLSGVHKAASQLPRTGPAAKVIVVSPNRVWPVSGDPHPLVTDLIGSTVQIGSVVWLPESRLGLFYTPDWAHVGAVVVLDFVRTLDEPHYSCTVLTNPKAGVTAQREWFPRARVCWFDGRAFWWTPNPPGDAHTLPDGTRLVTDTELEGRFLRETR